MELQISNVNISSSVEKKENKNIESLKKEARSKGEYIVSVSSDDKGLMAIARKFNMSLSEFKQMTGLTKDTLSKGQVIKNVPHAKIPDGKGLKFFAEQNGMTLEQFLTLNGIDKDYKPSKNEYFYVFPSKNKKPAAKTIKKSDKKGAELEKNKSVESGLKHLKQTSSPEEIAKEINKAVCSHYGAVGKEDFNKAFLKINDKNVREVIKAYDKLTNSDESLINAICSEIASPQSLRKDAVMAIYDNLAKQTNASSPKQRQEFKSELDKEFSKFIGMVNTEKMDAVIDKMINSKQNKMQTSVKSSNIVSNAEFLRSTNGGKSKDIVPETLTVIKDKSGNYVTAGTLRKWALAGGKNDPGFSKVKDPYLVRPLPNYNTETQKIEAVTELRQPLKSGDLNGKVVILNPGHGGYQQKNGAFDPGTVLSVKNAEGEEMPIEEWRVAESFVNKLSDKLRNRGAKVVFISGAVQNGGMCEQRYIENMLAGNKGSNDVRSTMKSTDKSDMLLLSVHVESAKASPSSKMCTVRYTKDIDKKLADNINKYVNKGFTALTPDVKSDNLYVNRVSKGVTSSLLEIGNIANESITNSLLSSYDQDKYMSCVADAIADTMNN